MFFFDELDNLTRVDTYSPEGRNRARYAYDNEKDPAQLTSVTHTLNYEDENIPETITLDYDADGNLLHDEAGRTLGYDELGRLISVSSGDGGPSQYRYDPLDTLAGQDGGSGGQERRFYADGKLANQIQAGNSSTFMRGEGVVLAEHQAGVGPKSLLMASDEKNSVLLELSQEGRNAIAYSAYGHRSADAPPSGHLSYNGERRETQTGWYLLGNGYRAFNPALMRFHSPDSWSPFGAGGVNAYMYVSGNPVENADPTGHITVGSFMRFFKLPTKSNKIAQKSADVLKALSAPSGTFDMVPLAKGVPPNKLSSGQYNLSGDQIIRHNNAVAFNESVDQGKKAYISMERYLDDVADGRVFSRPDVVDAVSAQRTEIVNKAWSNKKLYDTRTTNRGPQGGSRSFDIVDIRNSKDVAYPVADIPNNVRNAIRKSK